MGDTLRGMLLPLVVGCYLPPDLPPFQGVPIEGKPFISCAEEDEDVEVACVIDGDTLDLENCGEDAGVRVRLLGIDAPETEKPGQPAECYANEAWDFLSDLLLGEEVTVSYDKECTDIYDRTLAYLWLRDDVLEDVADDPDYEEFLWEWYIDPDEPAILVNELLLGLGLVRDYPEEIAGTLAFQGRLDDARLRAQQLGRGLWGACEGGR